MIEIIICILDYPLIYQENKNWVGYHIFWWVLTLSSHSDGSVVFLVVLRIDSHNRLVFDVAMLSFFKRYLSFYLIKNSLLVLVCPSAVKTFLKGTLLSHLSQADWVFLFFLSYYPLNSAYWLTTFKSSTQPYLAFLSSFQFLFWSFTVNPQVLWSLLNQMSFCCACKCRACWRICLLCSLASPGTLEICGVSHQNRDWVQLTSSSPFHCFLGVLAWRISPWHPGWKWGCTGLVCRWCHWLFCPRIWKSCQWKKGW